MYIYIYKYIYIYICIYPNVPRARHPEVRLQITLEVTGKCCVNSRLHWDADLAVLVLPSLKEVWVRKNGKTLHGVGGFGYGMVAFPSKLPRRRKRVGRETPVQLPAGWWWGVCLLVSHFERGKLQSHRPAATEKNVFPPDRVWDYLLLSGVV